MIHATASTADKAPGIDQQDSARNVRRSYTVGLALATILTLASFGVSSSHWVWAPAIPILLGVLAIAQMGVHLSFFLHISSAPDSRNNIMALAFGLFVVTLLVFGSMLIMANLNDNMMPMDQLMQMQR